MLQCNIDSKGKAIRLVNGFLLVLSGISLAGLWANRGGGWIAWVAAIFLILIGGFSIFEGWAGWCVVRAMGVKTRF